MTSSAYGVEGRERAREVSQNSLKIILIILNSLLILLNSNIVSHIIFDRAIREHNMYVLSFEGILSPVSFFPYYFTEIMTWSFTGVSGEVVSLAVSLPIVINSLQKVSVLWGMMCIFSWATVELFNSCV